MLDTGKSKILELQKVQIVVITCLLLEQILRIGTINYSTCHDVEKERYERDKNIQLRHGSRARGKGMVALGTVACGQGLTMPATLNAGVFNAGITDKKETDEKYLYQYA